MDIYCPKCGEPWDMDSLHEEVSEHYPDRPWEKAGPPGSRERQAAYEPYYSQIRQDFRRFGCSALTAYGAKCSTEPDTDAAEAMTALLDIMPDDLDGCAAMMEDFELFFR